MSIETIKVPDIGGAEDVEVIEVCVAIGDQIEKEDSLLVLESDKASMEIPSPHAGTVKSIKVSNGDTLSLGDIILELETDASEERVETAQDESVNTETAAQAVDEQPEPAIDEESKPSSSTAIETINIPDIGGAKEAEVIEVCIGVGDTVEEGDSLIVLETDKASMEVPSPKGGKVVSLAINVGDMAGEGTPVLDLEVSGPTAVKPQKATPAVNESKPAAETDKAPAAKEETAGFNKPAVATPANKSRVYAGPAVRMLARELGVDVHEVKGTGPRNRITKDDLKAFVKDRLSSGATTGLSSGSGIPALPSVDFSQFGEITTEKLSKIAKVTAENMQRSWLNIPHVTQFDDADITDLEDFRATLKAEGEKRGIKITPLPFILKACAAALKAHPKFNASLDSASENLVYKHYVHIGMAVDTPAGLMVPVIKDVDKKSIWELAAETVELADKAKNRKLLPADMQGGCFTISSLGAIGGQGFTPIVNAPEVAILGISKLAVKPVWNGAEFLPRKMLPLCLSYNHCAINGGDAGRFLTNLTELLSDIRLLVL